MIFSKFVKMAPFMGVEGSPDSGGESPSIDGDGATGSQPEPTSGPSVEYKYPEGIDDTLKGDKTLMKFANDKGEFNYANMMKSLVHLQKQVGKDKLVVPGPEADQDQWKEVYTKLGLPEDVKEYTLDVELPQGMEADKDFMEKFKEVAHQNGVLPKQAKAIFDFYSNTVQEHTTTQQQKINEQFEKATNELKSQYGEAYEKKMQGAYEALERFADPSDIEKLKEHKFLENPIMAKVFAKVYDGLISEDTFGEKTKGGMGLTRDELQEKIRSFYDPKHPFMNKTHKDHKFYAQEFLNLQSKITKLKK